MPAIPTNALFALAAAASWGGGDFSGGMGVKAIGGSTTGALKLVAVAHAASLAVLLLLLGVQHAPLRHGAPMLWGLAAGVAGGVSLAAFYIALSRGAMGASAAVSGVITATIPVLVSLAIEGSPSALRLAGFALACVAIWMIAAGPAPSGQQSSTMGLAILAGLGFGFYFVALRMANSLGVLAPMALARIASLVTCLLLLLAMRVRFGKANGAGLNRQAIFWAMGVALLDTGGNLLFVAASLVGRLDVSAVLSSLYPASTILLAAWMLKERPTRRQWTGMAVALAAVVMITL